MMVEFYHIDQLYVKYYYVRNYVNLYLEHVEEAHQLGLAYQPPRIHNLYSTSQHMLRFLEVLRRGDVREAVWRNYQQALTQAEAAVNQTIIDANRQLTESARNGTTLEIFALFKGQKALQFKLSRASHSKPKSAPSSTSETSELIGMVRELLRENKKIKQLIKQLQARSDKDPTGLGLGAEAFNPSWHCNHSSIDFALCVPANGAKVYRHMHRLVPNSWEQLDPTLISCTPIRYGVQYCKGPEIEYVEENHE